MPCRFKPTTSVFLILSLRGVGVVGKQLPPRLIINFTQAEPRIEIYYGNTHRNEMGQIETQAIIGRALYDST